MGIASFLAAYSQLDVRLADTTVGALGDAPVVTTVVAELGSAPGFTIVVAVLGEDAVVVVVMEALGDAAGVAVTVGALGLAGKVTIVSSKAPNPKRARTAYLTLFSSSRMFARIPECPVGST